MAFNGQPVLPTGSPSAADVFGDCHRGLKIKAEWLNQILQGAKTIEIRNTKCPHKGDVLLIETVSQLIRGRVEILGSHLMSEEEKQDNAEAMEVVKHYKQHWAWDLGLVSTMPQPVRVPSAVGFGAQTWVTRERWEAFDQGQLPARSAAVDRRRPRARGLRKRRAPRKANV